MIFQSRSSYPIGLDISDLSLKAVQLNKLSDKIKIQALGQRELPEGVIEHGEIRDKENLAKAIDELISKPDFGQFTSKEAFTCLPETRTFIKLMEIEKTINPLQAIIESEMEKYIPLATKEMYFDWQIISDSKTTQSILVGASPQKLVDQYTELLNISGLSPVALEIEPISLCRSLLLEEKPIQKKSQDNTLSNYCIFDLGTARSCIILYSKNTILFTLSVPISGDDITKKISNNLKLDYIQAENAKIACGLDEKVANKIVFEIIKDLGENIVEKINDAIIFYKENYPDRGEISQILLSGGGAEIKNLKEFVENKMKISTKIGNSLQHVQLNKNEYEAIFIDKQNKKNIIEQAQKAYPNYATAIGLALRGIFADNL